ncbi:hypothetical protein [Thermococcus sp.]
METMILNNEARGINWAINPFKELHEVWAELVELHKAGGNVHLVGRIKEIASSIVDIELSPTAFDRDVRLILREENEVFFIIPVSVMEGIEGAYLKILEALEEA